MDMLDVSVAKLDNGMRVLTCKLSWAKSIAIGVWFRVGSMHERNDEHGIAHFTEHLLFKGTRRHSGRAIARLIDDMGAYLEAFTERELTCYYARVLPEYLPRMVKLMAELITEPALRHRDIIVEREVVLAEINEANDTPDELVQDAFMEAIWNGHPLARSVLGKPETVRQFTVDSVMEFMQRFYTADNAIVTAAGCVDHERFVDAVERAFNSFGGHARMPRNSAPHARRGVKAIPRSMAQLYFCIGMQAFSQRQRRCFLASILLDLIMGGNASSRLFQSIRERLGLAYSIGTTVMGLCDAGLFAITGSCTPNHLNRVLTALHREINALLEKGIKRTELERAKMQLRASTVMAQESVMGQMFQMG
ncbi:MAG TPA: insulinase family protein, partial [Armatimonadetes bacterium]|nr:insulinase family protein [Armatimonadota bacterium]